MVARRAVFALVLASALVATPSFATDFTWHWSTPSPQGNNLWNMAFEDGQTGYAVGNRGTVLRTLDGGAAWALRSQAPDLLADLRDVVLLGPGELLAVGGAPYVFRSHDGGVTWSDVPNAATQLLADLDLLPGGDMVAVGDSGIVMRSGDDGVTWQRLPSLPTPAEMRIQLWTDALHGIVGGDFMLRRTADGGQTWTPVVGLPQSASWNEIYYTTDGVLHLVADFADAVSVDDGLNWTFTQVLNEQVYQSATVRLTDLHWFRVTRVEGAAIFETIDGGETWESRHFDSGANGFNDLTRLPDGTMLAVGTEGASMRSTDGGQTWQHTDACACTSPRPVISNLAMLPGGRTFATTTPSGPANWSFLRSDDGGASWVQQANRPNILFLNAFTFASPLVGYAGGSGGQGAARVWRTGDGGDTWNPIDITSPISPTMQIFDLNVSSPDTAWGVGFGSSNGTAVYRTIDGGLSWSPRSTGIPLASSTLRALFFVNNMVGWAAGGSFGETNKIWKTVNGGASWSQLPTSGMGNFFADLHFFDEQNGLATSWASPGIYRTSNGGTTWTPVCDVPARHFSFDGPLGWATTSYPALGVALRTADAGQTWETVQLPMQFETEAVMPFEGGVLIGSQNCGILRGVEAGVVTVPSVTHASDLSLAAAPNAGTRITLRFALPTAGPADLSIFDLQGRRVALLARGSFAAGQEVHRVWSGNADDGRSLPAGTYFARLSAGRGAAAVKVALLR